MWTPTLFSVSYAGLWGQHRLSLQGFVERAARLGYPAVELMAKRPHLSVVDADDSQLDEMRHYAAAHGVEIATLAAYTDFTLAAGTEIPAAELQLYYLQRLARAAQLLGAKIIRVFTGYTTAPDAYQSDWDACVRAIREAAKIAADHGVLIGVQNHHDVAVGVEAFFEFLHDVDHPSCKAIFDPWSPALQDADLYACAQQAAPYMVQTTLADYVRLKRFAYQPGLVNYRPLDAMVRAVPLGEGFIDLEAFFAGLHAGGFRGYVAYEMCSPLRGGGSEQNLDSAAATALERIRQWTCARLATAAAAPSTNNV